MATGDKELRDQIEKTARELADLQDRIRHKIGKSEAARAKSGQAGKREGEKRKK